MSAVQFDEAALNAEAEASADALMARILSGASGKPSEDFKNIVRVAFVHGWRDGHAAGVRYAADSMASVLERVR